MSSRTTERQLGECALQSAAVIERCDHDVDVGPDDHNAKEYVQIYSLSLFRYALPLSSSSSSCTCWHLDLHGDGVFEVTALWSGQVYGFRVFKMFQDVCMLLGPGKAQKKFILECIAAMAQGTYAAKTLYPMHLAS